MDKKIERRLICLLLIGVLGFNLWPWKAVRAEGEDSNILINSRYIEVVNNKKNIFRKIGLLNTAGEMEVDIRPRTVYVSKGEEDVYIKVGNHLYSVDLKLREDDTLYGYSYVEKINFNTSEILKDEENGKQDMHLVVNWLMSEDGQLEKIENWPIMTMFPEIKNENPNEKSEGPTPCNPYGDEKEQDLSKDGIIQKDTVSQDGVNFYENIKITSGGEENLYWKTKLTISVENYLEHINLTIENVNVDKKDSFVSLKDNQALIVLDDLEFTNTIKTKGQTNYIDISREIIEKINENLAKDQVELEIIRRTNRPYSSHKGFSQKVDADIKLLNPGEE